MAINIEMPKLSDTMVEGTLLTWRKKVGDSVEIGDIIADIETDKATMEMEAFDEGVIGKILVAEGSKVPVGGSMGIILEDGETLEDVGTLSEISSSVTTKEQPVAEENKIVTSSSVQPLNTENAERIKVSPLARKIAKSKAIDLSAVQGTGPGGRIVKRDLENLNSTTGTAPVSQSSVVLDAIKPHVADGDVIRPLSNMRKIIAERLLQSKQTIPHFYLRVETNAESLISFRKQVNAQVEEGGNKYTFNDFIIKALVSACKEVREVNASFNGESIVEFFNVGVSVAMAVADGLVTPVIKDAQTKSMLQISQEVKEMAARAREGRLHPSEFDGGTITISNLGAWGIESFDAIVNPPQAAILSVGGIVEKAVSVNGKIQSGQRMTLGLSCDHRVVDGAVAAEFLNKVKRFVENPSLMLL